MKNKLFILSILLIVILISSSVILSQNQIEERPDLRQDIIDQAKIFDFEERELDNISVTIYQFRGTVEEALRYKEERLLKDESKKPEMKYSRENVSEMLAGIRNLSEYGVISPLDEEWIEASLVEEEKLKDLKQTTYFGKIEYSDMEKEVVVQNPFFSPTTFKLEEGTYIIYSEYKLNEENDN